MFLKVEETRSPRGNSSKHMENMQTPHRRARFWLSKGSGSEVLKTAVPLMITWCWQQKQVNSHNNPSLKCSTALKSMFVVKIKQLWLLWIDSPLWNNNLFIWMMELEMWPLSGLESTIGQHHWVTSRWLRPCSVLSVVILLLCNNITNINALNQRENYTYNTVTGPQKHLYCMSDLRIKSFSHNLLGNFQSQVHETVWFRCHNSDILIYTILGVLYAHRHNLTWRRLFTRVTGG